MDSCDECACACKNGETFDLSRNIAESMNPDFKKHFEEKGKFCEIDIRKSRS